MGHLISACAVPHRGGKTPKTKQTREEIKQQEKCWPTSIAAWLFSFFTSSSINLRLYSISFLRSCKNIQTHTQHYIRWDNFLVPMQCTGNPGGFPGGKRAAIIRCYPAFLPPPCVQCFCVSISLAVRPTLLRQMDTGSLQHMALKVKPPFWDNTWTLVLVNLIVSIGQRFVIHYMSTHRVLLFVSYFALLADVCAEYKNNSLRNRKITENLGILLVRMNM